MRVGLIFGDFDARPKKHHFGGHFCHNFWTFLNISKNGTYWVVVFLRQGGIGGTAAVFRDFVNMAANLNVAKIQGIVDDIWIGLVALMCYAMSQGQRSTALVFAFVCALGRHRSVMLTALLANHYPAPVRQAMGLLVSWKPTMQAFADLMLRRQYFALPAIQPMLTMLPPVIPEMEEDAAPPGRGRGVRPPAPPIPANARQRPAQGGSPPAAPAQQHHHHHQPAQRAAAEMQHPAHMQQQQRPGRLSLHHLPTPKKSAGRSAPSSSPAQSSFDDWTMQDVNWVVNVLPDMISEMQLLRVVPR